MSWKEWLSSILNLLNFTKTANKQDEGIMIFFEHNTVAGSTREYTHGVNPVI